MRSKKREVMIAFAMLLVAGTPTLLPGQTFPRPAPTTVKEAVLARLGEIEAAAKALDPDKVFSFVMENDQGSLIQSGEIFLTRSQALASTKQGFQGLQEIDYQFDQQHVALLSPTMALATGQGTTTATLQDGRKISQPFAQSVIFVLVDGEWKMFHAHRSIPRTK